MAILVVFYGKGITKDMYEALRKEIRWESQPAPGGVLHAAGFDEAGNIHVADIWESEQDLNNFVSGQLAPAMKKLNIPMPEVKVYSAHNINVFSKADKYKV